MSLIVSTWRYAEQMKLSILALCFLLSGCSSLSTNEKQVNRESKAYKAAVEWIGRDAKEEFEKNKNDEKLRFYGFSYHFEGGYEIPGISQDEFDLYVENEKTEVEIIHDDMIPFWVGDRGFKGQHYWAALEDFTTKYNQMVLTEIKEKHIKSVLTTPEAALPTS